MKQALRDSFRENFVLPEFEIFHFLNALEVIRSKKTKAVNISGFLLPYGDVRVIFFY